MKIIDVHHHVIPDVYRDGLKELGIVYSGGKKIAKWSIQDSLDFMEKLHITRTYWSISEPALYLVVAYDGHKAQTIARQTNVFFAQAKHDHPDQFGMFALLPMPDVKSSIEEAIYALDVLKLDGIGLLSNYGDHYLGDDLFDELFAVLDQRQAIIYVHPSVPS